MGRFGCCGSSGVEPDKPEPETFFFKKRGCTDVFCVVIFVVFWGILGWLTSLSITYGEPWAIIYGSDYLGNRCGRDSMSDKPKVYYPRVDKDLQDQALIASSTPWKLRFYGLCVKECPSVTEPTACFSDPDSCKVEDYGTEAQYTAAGGSAYYYATMPSQDVLNRCVPKDSASLDQDDDRCAFPQCDNVTNPWMECDETYPTTWKMKYPHSLKCEVKFRVGTVQQLRTMSSDTLSRSLGQYVQGMASMAESLADAQNEILIFGLAMPVVLGFLWLLLLKLFAKTIVYVGLAAIGAALVFFTFYCFLMTGFLSELSANSTLSTNSTDSTGEATDAMVTLASAESAGLVSDTGEDPTMWYVVGAISLLVTFLYILSMCMARRKIKTAVQLVKESTNVIKDRPQTLFFPFNIIVLQCGILFFFLLLLAFLSTASLDKSHFLESDAVKASGSYVDAIAYYNKTGASGVEDDAASATQVQIVVYLYVFFGLLWTIECVNNVSFTTMSGNVCHWYFFRDDEKGATRAPILRSLGRVLRYHLGTIAFGSFIVAVIKLVRYVLMAIDKYTKDAQGKNLLLKIVLKCTMCCMYCLEKTVKFITGYAYIYVALQGSGFCASCFATFGLITSNPAQLAINNLIRAVLGWIQILAVPMGCAWLGNIVLVASGKKEPMVATVCIAFMALVIAYVFATVFACVLDSLFVCACRDKADYAGKYMPDGLKTAFGFDKKRKNDKSAEDEDELVQK